MKKIYSVCSALLLSAAAFAQVNHPKTTNNQRLRPEPFDGTRAQAVATDDSGPRGGAVVLFSEDFSNGLAGNNPFGPMVTEDSGTSPIWKMANATAPNGQFAGNIAALASPTSTNGWVIFDADEYNNPVSDGVEDVNGTLTTPTLDFTDASTVIVEWYQYFRYCCFAPSPLTLEVSVDGGISWVVFPAIGSVTPAANNLSPNPLKTSVDVSCVAANQSSVLLRWGYNTGAVAGYSHYFWGIDDITVFQNPVSNDLSIRDVMTGDVFNLFEYYMTPLEQAITAGNGGLYAGVAYKNGGFNDQPTANLLLEILDSDETTVLYSSSNDLGTVASFANSAECPTFLFDTLWVETGWVPTATGVYYLRATISSDSTDVNPADNVLTQRFEYSENEYGHDNQDSLTIQVLPQNLDNSTTVWYPHGWGSFFNFPNPNSNVFGVGARFGSSTMPGAVFNALLYNTNDNINTNGEVIGTGEFTMLEGWISASNDFYQYFPFEQPAVVTVGPFYFGAILVQSETTERVTLLAANDGDTDRSTASYSLNGDEELVWIGARPFTPAIRLVLQEFVGVGELAALNIEQVRLYPNPAAHEARLNFTLNGSHGVAYEVRDMNGRLVKWSNVGRFSQGTNTFSFDVSQLPAGTYNVGVVIDGQKMYRQNLVIVR